MPELPEVEAFRRYINATSLHKTIKKAKVKSPSIIQGISVVGLQAELKGSRFLFTRRHGKYLFVRTNVGHWMVLHFGMTGNLKYFKNLARDPAHDRFRINFSNGYHLAFDCQRKFCRIGLLKSIEDFIEEKELGPDALSIDFRAFGGLLGRREGAIKCTLMNQHIIAGIGNLYSDEILFQAGIHPSAKANALCKGDLKKLFEGMKRILSRAIYCQADYGRFPDSFLIPHRFLGGKCPRCGNKIERMTICGRTAFYCPICQLK